MTPYLQNDNSLVLGDVNAHDALWHSNIYDERGSDMADEIINSNLGVINEEHPTRIPTNGQPTSPDISLASLNLLPYTKWETITTMGSDHVPIIITMSSSINFRKANWESFQNQTEERFESLPEPTNIYTAEKTFRKIVQKAANQNIPAGRIIDTIPEIPSSAREKIERRDMIRTNNPESEEIADLNTTIYKEIGG